MRLTPVSMVTPCSAWSWRYIFEIAGGRILINGASAASRIVTSVPSERAVAATSDPINPPPTIRTDPAPMIASRSDVVSARPRNVWIRSPERVANSRARPPVASSNASNVSVSPSDSATVRRSGSIVSALMPERMSMSFSVHAVSDLRSARSAVIVPASKSLESAGRR